MGNVEYKRPEGVNAIQFQKTVTLASTTAFSSPSEIISSNEVPTGKTAYVHGFRLQVTGGTAWSGGTLTGVQIQGTNGTDIAGTVLVANLTANVEHYVGGANVTHGDAFINNTGFSDLEITGLVGDAGAGSDISVTVFGVFA